MDKISVILPCYNVEKYVLSCLKSIERQTIGLENLQVILINDASSDNTLTYLQVFKEKYPDNVFLVDLKNRVGVSAARNIGLDFSVGEYITFVDSDDLIASDMIERLYAKACETNCEIVACEHSTFLREKEINEIFTDAWEIDDLTDVDVRKKYILRMTSPMFMTVWGKLYRADFLKKYSLRFLEGHVYEDTHYSAMCILLASSFCRLEQRMYYYRKNENSITHTKHNPEVNCDHMIMAKHIYDNMKELGIYDECMEKYGYEIRALFVWIGFFAPAYFARKAYLDEMNSLKEELFKTDPEILSNPYVTNITDPLFLEYLELLK